MSSRTDARLTARERLTRGLKYSAVGPVDVTRGALGLGLHSAQSSAAWVGERYRRARVSRNLAAAQATIAEELAAAQEVVANLPQALQDARRSRRRRPWILAGVGAVALAGGAVAFSIIRRSSKPEPSPRPPSVEVAPKP